MKKNTITILTVVIASMCLIAGSALACDGNKGYTKACDGSKSTEARMTSAKAEGKTVVLNVSNMTCGSCVNHVTKSLAAVDGVTDVTVSLDKGTAEVVYDEAKATPEMFTAAVVKAGYPAQMADVTTASDKKAGCDPAACAARKSADKGACGTKSADAGTGDK